MIRESHPEILKRTQF